MTDAYPPFRLDQGGRGARRGCRRSRLPRPPEAAASAPAPSSGTGGRRSGPGRRCSSSAASRQSSPSACSRAGARSSRSTRHSATTTASSCRRPRTSATSTYAIVSESADIDVGGAEWALDGFLGTVRIRSESDRPVFVGIGPRDRRRRVTSDGVEHDVVADFERRAALLAAAGRRAREPAGRAGVLGRVVGGVGEQTLDWEPEDGDWTRGRDERGRHAGVSRPR